MANDLGGNAKTLFSVEDGDGNPLTADFDLLVKDVNAAGVSPRGFRRAARGDRKIFQDRIAVLIDDDRLTNRSRKKFAPCTTTSD